ncbi:MAG: YcgN family cysteine cluster protein [Alphaproteobacteria bacterium]|nr:YcgN family cysteine cluster protein [Alphaproteobacteria bacterium]
MTKKRAASRDGETPFWRQKTLAQMTDAEWESLCDGCGKCCLNKIEVITTGKFLYTSVACRLLDQQACRCTDYANRTKRVKGCVALTPRNVGRLKWMPSTCAYRLIHEGKDLPEWHPLVSGDPESVHEAGISVRGKVVSETEVDEIADFIVKWAK